MSEALRVVVPVALPHQSPAPDPFLTVTWSPACADVDPSANEGAWGSTWPAYCKSSSPKLVPDNSATATAHPTSPVFTCACVGGHAAFGSAALKVVGTVKLVPGGSVPELVTVTNFNAAVSASSTASEDGRRAANGLACASTTVPGVGTPWQVMGNIEPGG